MYNSWQLSAPFLAKFYYLLPGPSKPFMSVSAQKPAQSLQMKIVSYKKYIFLPLSMKHNLGQVVKESTKEKNISSKYIFSQRQFDQVSFLCSGIVTLFSPFNLFSRKIC